MRILLSLLLLIAVSCSKTRRFCKSEYWLDISISVENQKYISHIELQIEKNDQPFSSYYIFTKEKGDNHIYKLKHDITNMIKDVKIGDEFKIRYEVFDWRDGSSIFTQPEAFIK